MVTSSAAKAASAAAVDGSRRERLLFLLFSPLLSMRSWNRRMKPDKAVVLRAALKFVAGSVALALFYRFVKPLVGTIPGWWLKGYAAVIPFWLFFETIGAYIQICFCPFGILLPPVSNAPHRCNSSADLWGRRWNRIHGDWLRDTVFSPLRRKPSLALMATFAVSGLLHEVLVNVPLYAVYGVSQFGSMLVFFFIQAGWVAVERRWLRRSAAKRWLALLVLLVPSPLVLNEGTLRIFHFV